jgi:hypothetical protein
LPAGPAVDRNHAALDREPAEDRDPHQLALEDVGGVVEQGEVGEGLPQGLVLGGDDEPSRRDALPAPHLELHPGHDPQEPERGARLHLRHPDEPEARQQEEGQERHHPQDEVDVVEGVEKG